MTKLNNRGWGMGTFIAGIGVFAIALLVIVILVHNGAQILEPNHDVDSSLNPKYDETIYDYTKLENKVIKSANEYATDKYSESLDDDTLITVTLKKLQKENYLDNIYDLKNTNSKCSGYVSFYKKNNIFNFEPYINCKNYKTKGYEGKFDD